MEKELLAKIQQQVNEILFVIDRFCTEKDIPYYLFYGTALGAVRHGGFIPWDDDADLVMFRADYERFREEWLRDPQEGYFFQDVKTDPGYRLKITKIRKNNTAFVEPQMKDDQMHHGLFVDIFVLDDYVKNPFLRRVTEYITMFDYNAYRNYRPESGMRKYLYPITNRIFKGEKVFRFWMDKVFPKLKKDETMCSDIASFTHSHRYDFKRAWFGNGKRLFYDGMLLNLPENTHEPLRVCYGDYMTPPPPEKQVSNHKLYALSFDREYHPGDEGFLFVDGEN